MFMVGLINQQTSLGDFLGFVGTRESAKQNSPKWNHPQFDELQKPDRNWVLSANQMDAGGAPRWKTLVYKPGEICKKYR